VADLVFGAIDVGLGRVARAQFVDRGEQRRQARVRGLHEALVGFLRETLLTRLVQRGIDDLPRLGLAGRGHGARSAREGRR
jgi:hypothetical protein